MLKGSGTVQETLRRQHYSCFKIPPKFVQINKHKTIIPKYKDTKTNKSPNDYMFTSKRQK